MEDNGIRNNNSTRDFPNADYRNAENNSSDDTAPLTNSGYNSSHGCWYPGPVPQNVPEFNCEQLARLQQQHWEIYGRHQEAMQMHYQIGFWSGSQQHYIPTQYQFPYQQPAMAHPATFVHQQPGVSGMISTSPPAGLQLPAHLPQPFFRNDAPTSSAYNPHDDTFPCLLNQPGAVSSAVLPGSSRPGGPIIVGEDDSHFASELMEMPAQNVGPPPDNVNKQPAMMQRRGAPVDSDDSDSDIMVVFESRPKQGQKQQEVSVKKEEQPKVQVQTSEVNSRPKVQVQVQTSEVTSRPKVQVQVQTPEVNSKPKVQVQTSEVKSQVQTSETNSRAKVQVQVQTSEAKSQVHTSEVKSQVHTSEVKSRPKVRLRRSRDTKDTKETVNAPLIDLTGDDDEELPTQRKDSAASLCVAKPADADVCVEEKKDKEVTARACSLLTDSKPADVCVEEIEKEVVPGPSRSMSDYNPSVACVEERERKETALHTVDSPCNSAQTKPAAICGETEKKEAVTVPSSTVSDSNPSVVWLDEQENKEVDIDSSVSISASKSAVGAVACVEENQRREEVVTEARLRVSNSSSSVVWFLDEKEKETGEVAIDSPKGDEVTEECAAPNVEETTAKESVDKNSEVPEDPTPPSVEAVTALVMQSTDKLCEIAEIEEPIAPNVKETTGETDVDMNCGDKRDVVDGVDGDEPVTNVVDSVDDEIVADDVEMDIELSTETLTLTDCCESPTDSFVQGEGEETAHESSAELIPVSPEGSGSSMGQCSDDTEEPMDCSATPSCAASQPVIPKSRDLSDLWKKFDENVAARTRSSKNSFISVADCERDLLEIFSAKLSVSTFEPDIMNASSMDSAASFCINFTQETFTRRCDGAGKRSRAKTTEDLPPFSSSGIILFDENGTYFSTGKIRRGAHEKVTEDTRGKASSSSSSKKSVVDDRNHGKASAQDPQPIKKPTSSLLGMKRKEKEKELNPKKVAKHTGPVSIIDSILPPEKPSHSTVGPCAAVKRPGLDQLGSGHSGAFVIPKKDSNHPARVDLREEKKVGSVSRNILPSSASSGVPARLPPARSEEPPKKLMRPAEASPPRRRVTISDAAPQVFMIERKVRKENETTMKLQNQNSNRTHRPPTVCSMADHFGMLKQHLNLSYSETLPLRDQERKKANDRPDANIPFSCAEEYQACVNDLKEVCGFDARLKFSPPSYVDCDDNQIWRIFHRQNGTGTRFDVPAEEKKWAIDNKAPMWRLVDSETQLKWPFPSEREGLYWPIVDGVDMADLHAADWDSTTVRNIMADNSYDGARARSAMLACGPSESHKERVARLLRRKQPAKRFAARYACRRALEQESHEVRKSREDANNSAERRRFANRHLKSVADECRATTVDFYSISKCHPETLAPEQWYGPLDEVLITENNNKIYFKEWLGHLEASNRYVGTTGSQQELLTHIVVAMRQASADVLFMDDRELDSLSAEASRQAHVCAEIRFETFDATSKRFVERCKVGPDFTYLSEWKDADQRVTLMNLLISLSRNNAKFNPAMPQREPSLSKLTFEQLMYLCRLRDWEKLDWTIVYQNLQRYFPSYAPLSLLPLRDLVDQVFQDQFTPEQHRSMYYDMFRKAMEEERDRERLWKEHQESTERLLQLQQELERVRAEKQAAAMRMQTNYQRREHGAPLRFAYESASNSNMMMAPPTPMDSDEYGRREPRDVRDRRDRERYESQWTPNSDDYSISPVYGSGRNRF